MQLFYGQRVGKGHIYHPPQPVNISATMAGVGTMTGAIINGAAATLPTTNLYDVWYQDAGITLASGKVSSWLGQFAGKTLTNGDDSGPTYTSNRLVFSNARYLSHNGGAAPSLPVTFYFVGEYSGIGNFLVMNSDFTNAPSFSYDSSNAIRVRDSNGTYLGDTPASSVPLNTRVLIRILIATTGITVQINNGTPVVFADTDMAAEFLWMLGAAASTSFTCDAFAAYIGTHSSPDQSSAELVFKNKYSIW